VAGVGRFVQFGPTPVPWRYACRGGQLRHGALPLPSWSQHAPLPGHRVVLAARTCGSAAVSGAVIEMHPRRANTSRAIPEPSYNSPPWRGLSGA
jgi:hypothetical protein